MTQRAHLLRGKTTRNGNGAADHGGVTGGAGYGVAAAAREISALRDTIKGAIDEAVSQALEDKLGDHEAKGDEEHALAMRQLREDNAARKKEIEDLSRAINELTKQIRELKNCPSSRQGEQAAQHVATQEEEDRIRVEAWAQVQQELEPRKKETVQQALQRERPRGMEEGAVGKARAPEAGPGIG